MQKDHTYMQGTICYTVQWSIKSKKVNQTAETVIGLSGTEIFLVFPTFYLFDHFRRPVVFKHFPNLSYLVGVHNPLKSFSKTTQIQLI